MTEAEAAATQSENYRDPETAQQYFATGWDAERQNNYPAAVEAYEAAYTADPDDPNVCFRLAYNLDLMGEEDEAVHLYEQCIQNDQPSLNALVNLAVLYEDRGQYAAAERCIRQVLATDPNHPRARLYLKDILASKAMVIDDEHERKLEKQTALLDTPVSDFELTARTRNALSKMNIRTLGDLLKVTEMELRSYKNFGDASLDEIKRMLAQKGLKLGQSVEQQQEQAKQQVYDELKEQTGGDDEVLSKSVNELNLSVRARKALALLNITTIGDLAMKTEAELMGVKNFGMTSLLEIKEKLGEMGVNLRKLDTDEEGQASAGEGAEAEQPTESAEQSNGDGETNASADAE
jgi:DNA-directed RNA polymerase subunit alpha